MSQADWVSWAVTVYTPHDGLRHIVHKALRQTRCGAFAVGEPPWTEHHGYEIVRTCDFDDLELCEACRREYEAVHGIATPDPLKGL